MTSAESLPTQNSLLYSNRRDSKHQACLFCIISYLWCSRILLYLSSVENTVAFFNQWWDRTSWCFKYFCFPFSAKRRHCIWAHCTTHEW